MAKVQKKKGSSMTWRGIATVWEKFKQGIGVRIGNGLSASFWYDNWSGMNKPLIELIPEYAVIMDKDEKVADYVTPWGQWDRSRLGRWLHPRVIDRVMCAQPPSEERGQDKYFWKPSSDGLFSVRSAYHFLFAGTHQEVTPVWKTLWKWAVPEKVKFLMWLVNHDRLHTAQLRHRRGLSDNANCPFHCEQEEDVMHVLRECINAKERWISFVNPTMWDKFTSLHGREWV